MSGLYSPINKLMEQVTRPKGTGAEYMAELQKKPGYKPAEAEDRDLQALMALPQMERAAFMEKLKAQQNSFPLKQRELTGAQTHHEDYTLPGGENYREILLHTPERKFQHYLTPEDEANAKRSYGAPQKGSTYPGKEYHFGGIPGILASIRVKDRTTPEGKKMLHIEEIQSDWHQHGREHGYDPRDFSNRVPQDKFFYDTEEHREHLNKGNPAPYGPHAKDWHELALKAMIQHAAENGYDQIGITPGAEQAKRYGLSAHVNEIAVPMVNADGTRSIRIEPKEGQNIRLMSDENGVVQGYGSNSDQFTGKHISRVVGKDMAAKIMQAKENGTRFAGEGLEVGGEGMKGFYDRMVPSFLNKFGKKHGVQVQQGAIGTDQHKVVNDGHADLPHRVSGPEGFVSRHAIPEEAQARAAQLNQAPVHTFDITPQMREDILKNGIPRYADGGDVSRETADANLAKFLEPSKEKRRMYHGTRHYPRKSSLKADPNYTENMRNTGGFEAITPGIRGMSFVTPDTEFANEYAGENKKADKMSGAVYPVHVQVKNPFDYENPVHVKAVAKLLKPTDNKWAMHYGKNPKQIHDRLASGAWEYIEDPDVQAAAKKLGHDAMYMNEHGVKNLGVFNPNAIKSAIGNRGTYDINEPHMNKATGGSVKDKVTIQPSMDVMQYELINRKAK